MPPQPRTPPPFACSTAKPSASPCRATASSTDRVTESPRPINASGDGGRVPAEKPASDALRRNKAPRWRDLTEAALVYAHTAAGYNFGRVSAFTLNLTADVEAKARTKPNPAAWLRDLIARRLEAALGRPVEVLASLELNGLGALHVHGIVAGVVLGEEAAVKSALTLAGGDGFRGPQVLLKPSPDSGWASYMAKDFIKAFKWKHRYAATRGLSSMAREVFAGMTAFMLECDTSNTPESADVKLTLTVRVASTLENNYCDAEHSSLTISRHTSSAGEACINAHSRKNSSPTFGKACRSRDGPTPDG